ncbi:MAG: ABC transporter substrate-binding protein [Hyphomicrobium sp.]|uniref:ABC transporter substrate-binding protein n=1 Tax=Hyphomicrobium sp. TaxID=82 RepID=UPI0039E3A988
MSKLGGLLRGAALALLASSALATSHMSAVADEPPLRISYADWPGYVAWQVAIEKGWFKEAGVNIQFEWFDYSAAMDAYTAGKLDAINLTNGDTLGMGANGAKGIMFMVTDYSAGNDMIVGKPGIKSVADLKGKKVGLETGLVEHLLISYGLKKAGLSDKDVEIVNTKTNETPQVLGSADISAIGAWEPISGAAMHGVPGAHPIYTSADAPGLIYDVVTVKPESWASRKADWAKVLKVWDRVVAYVNDPKTQPDALKIMSARVAVAPEAYKKFLNGTKLLTVAEGAKVFNEGPGLDSLYGSSSNADEFNVKYGVYKDKQDIKSYIDPSIAQAK